MRNRCWCEASRKRERGDDFPTAVNFLKKKKKKNERRTHGPRMKDDSGRENGAFYGFIMRMVDQKGGSPRRDCNTWLPVSTALLITRVGKYLCVRGWPLFSCPLRNWVMSRHVTQGLLPNKIYIGTRGRCLFLPQPLPYIISEASSPPPPPYHRSCLYFSFVNPPRFDLLQILEVSLIVNALTPFIEDFI